MLNSTVISTAECMTTNKSAGIHRNHFKKIFTKIAARCFINHHNKATCCFRKKLKVELQKNFYK